MMFTYRPYLHTADDRIIDDRITITETEASCGVTAVTIHAMSPAGFHTNDSRIHPEKGVCIELTPTVPVKRFMADYRYCEFWCRPQFGEELAQIPDETQALILELEDGRYCAVVPVVNDTWKCVLQGNENGGFTARMFAWCTELYVCRGLSFVYAIGERPSVLMKQCVQSALKLLGSGIRSREERRYPEIFDYLGWCSWDSMQIRVNEEGILQKCEEFKTKEIPVKWAIFDDMWAEIRDFYGQTYNSFSEMCSLMHRSAMWHFEADPIRFPKGLAHTIAGVKEYGMKVGMWHPTTGYWRGIDPEGAAYPLLKDYLMTTDRSYLVPDWHQDKAYMYYKTFHDFFRKCGADFVKIDNQTMTRRFYRGEAPVGKVARSFHNGMEASVGEHFDGVMINCMGMGSEDIWNRTCSAISRCSDDFKPEDRAWFTKHILQCAYNSMFQGEFYWCDWDMWWSDDGQAAKNSLMRAVSGGPIYVSDMLERSRPEIFKPLAFEDGKILRCDRPGVPTHDCVTIDPTENGKALKLQNMVGEHGILAVLNLDKDNAPVSAVIRGEDIDGFEAEEYAVYEHYSRELKVLKKGESFAITLQDADDYKLYILAPIHDGFAAIGRIDKFISPAAIDRVIGTYMFLKEPGPCAIVKDGELLISE